MTEDEAREKWCPMVRHTDNESGGANRWLMGENPDPKWGTPNNPSVCRCIASECMWWVWENGRIVNGKLRKTRGHCGAVK